MKYNIQINQDILSKTSLDLIDSAILDYLYIYCNSLNEKIDKQRIKDEFGIWTWVNYQTILKDMPLLRIKSSSALTPRFKSIEEEGVIKIRREGNQKLYIKLTDKIDELFIKTNSNVHENKQLSSKSCSRKRTNNNTIYNTTKDNIATLPVADKVNIQPIIELFKNVNPSYEILFRNKTQRQALTRLVEKWGEEKVRGMIEYLPKSNNIKYFPTICTPLELENKLGTLIACMNREKLDFNENKIVKI